MLGNLLASSVDYGPSLGGLGDFSTAVLNDETRELSVNRDTEWKSVTATDKVKDEWANRSSRGGRSQYRIQFETDINSNGISDYAFFYTGDSTSKPYLTVVYEYP